MFTIETVYKYTLSFVEVLVLKGGVVAVVLMKKVVQIW